MVVHPVQMMRGIVRSSLCVCCFFFTLLASVAVAARTPTAAARAILTRMVKPLASPVYSRLKSQSISRVFPFLGWLGSPQGRRLGRPRRLRSPGSSAAGSDTHSTTSQPTSGPLRTRGSPSISPLPSESPHSPSQPSYSLPDAEPSKRFTPHSRRKMNLSGTPHSGEPAFRGYSSLHTGPREALTLSNFACSSASSP